MTNPLVRPGAQSFNRRSFLRVAGLSVAGAGVLTACGSDEAAAPSTSASAPVSSAATTEAMTSEAMTSEAMASMSGSAAAVAPGTYGDIKLQLSWIKNIEFAGEFFATEKGYYTDAGFSSVELLSGPVPSADDLVATDNVLVGLSAPDATARYNIDQGATLKIIGSTFQKNPFCILSLEEGTPIRTPADLVGKNIGIQAGTNQEIFDGFLKANSIDKESITFTIVQFDPAPLLENQVDGFMAYATNEPFIAERDGKTPVVLLFSDNGLPLTAETFTVTQKTIDEQRDLLKAFLLAEIKGWKDAIADPEESARLAAEIYGADLNLDPAGQAEEAAAQNDLIVSADTDANGIFTLTDVKISEIIAAIALTGYETTAEDLFDMTLLNEVYAENPDLI